MAPLSRGNVTINSSSALDPPVIQPNWFGDAGDREVAIAAFKRVRQIWSSISNITIGPEFAPGAAVASDDQIFQYIQQSSVTLYHASATCKMGQASDPNAVLDSQARVFGVQNLRVVDISSFPFALPGHPQASVYMLAEKIASDILGTH